MESPLSRALRFGISPALVTPFTPEGRVDTERLFAHASDLLGRGCRSATLFGTTGEGPSVSGREREAVAADLVARGISADKLVEGVIACSVEEAAFNTRRALERGAKAVLLAPPFYFRGGPDDALFAWFEAVFREVGPGLRDILLYHIPGMTGAPLSIDLIDRLKAAYPGAILGVKDSSCDEPATMRLLAAHSDLVILVGDETYLGRACAAGAEGSICGLANFAPEAIIAVAEGAEDDPRVTAMVRAITAHSVIPTVKAITAHLRRDPGFAMPAPPLAPLSAEALRTVLPSFETLTSPVLAGAAE